MLEFVDFSFAAPPRCGAAWFARAAERAGLTPAPAGATFSVTLVRHPFTWLQSFYAAEVWRRPGLPAALTPLCEIAKQSVNMEVFFRNYFLIPPGAVTAVYGAYPAHAALRMEDFPWNVWEFFVSLGASETEAREATRGGPTNPGVYRPLADDKALRRRVVAAEPALCDLYEYYLW